MSDLLIKNGTVVFENDMTKADILVRNEKIAAILEPGQGPENVEVIDAKGLYIMPGSIDPHMHLGLYTEMGDSYKYDSRREAIGGLTTLIDYHRGKGNYFETTAAEIKAAHENSIVDFGLSLGLCSKKHMIELEDYVNKLGVTSFKFFFDKQDIAHTFYDIPSQEALTLDKADLYYMLKKLHEIDDKLLLCVHCEDPDMFRAFLKDKMEEVPNSTSMADYDAARPDFTESNCIAGSMLINGEVQGNMYVVHTSAKKSLEVYNTLNSSSINCGSVSLETCPQYLLLDKDSVGLDAKVNPALRSKADNIALWKGIEEGTIKTIGTDNVPINKAKKFEKGNRLWDVFVGFSTPGLVLPILISEGYHKKEIPLWRLSQVASINAARLFNLTNKGEIKVGYDADFAIMDLDWERTISPELYGYSDFSIYEGMTFKGWPRYTISRGEVIQKDGVVLVEPGRGKYIFRTLS